MVGDEISVGVGGQILSNPLPVTPLPRPLPLPLGPQVQEADLVEVTGLGTGLDETVGAGRGGRVTG